MSVTDRHNLKEKQPDHLFLLVGKNPLPNYAAAKLLVKHGAIVHFVYTLKTKDYKIRLVEKLEENFGKGFFKSNSICLDSPTEASKIKTNVKDHFGQIPNGARVALNYTGGTKSMSVHVYRAIEELGKPIAKGGKNCELQFSYLDPRTLTLNFDDGAKPLELNKPETEKELFETVKVKLRDLMNLHGLIFQRRGNGSEIFPSEKVKYEESLRVLSGYAVDEGKWADWQMFRNRNRSKLNYPERETVIEISAEFNDLAEALNKDGRQISRTDWVEDARR